MRGQLVVGLWFVASIAIEVLGNLALFVWLKARGAPVRFGRAGLPGYLDEAYLRFCRERNARAGGVLVARRLSSANVILAALMVLPAILGLGPGR